VPVWRSAAQGLALPVIPETEPLSCRRFFRAKYLGVAATSAEDRNGSRIHCPITPTRATPEASLARADLGPKDRSSHCLSVQARQRPVRVDARVSKVCRYSTSSRVTPLASRTRSGP
jgi:hypothetical protein